MRQSRDTDAALDGRVEPGHDNGIGGNLIRNRIELKRLLFAIPARASLGRDGNRLADFRTLLMCVYAASAMWLALSWGAASACELSLAGPVIQQPLVYNPFQAGTATAEVSFNVRNAGAKPCHVAFAFFGPDGPQARAGGSDALTYQVLSASGPAAQVALSAPAKLSASRALAHVTVDAKQTATMQAQISVGSGQVVGPGHYTDQLILGVYYRSAEDTYVRAAVTPFTVAIRVNAQMTLALAGGGRKTTLNFGGFVEGAIRSVQLLAYSNLCFHLVVSSDNAGVMKPLDSRTKDDWRWGVPYTIAINGGQPLTLSQPRPVWLGRGATAKSGLAIPFDVQVGSTKGQRAGYYRDVITIAIDPGA